MHEKCGDENFSFSTVCLLYEMSQVKIRHNVKNICKVRLASLNQSYNNEAAKIQVYQRYAKPFYEEEKLVLLT